MITPENISFPKAKDTGSAAKLVAALFLYSIFTDDTI
jgi:diacylglycerol kinase